MKEMMTPEALHDVHLSTEKAVGDFFVNPGTPIEPLVGYEQMTSATIQSKGNDVLRASIVK